MLENPHTFLVKTGSQLIFDRMLYAVKCKHFLDLNFILAVVILCHHFEIYTVSNQLFSRFDKQVKMF